MKKFVLLKCILALSTVAGMFGSAFTNNAAAADWQNEITVYGWFSDISGTLYDGTEYTYEVEDIVDDLEMIFMGNYEGRIGKWSFMGDVVYLDVGDQADTTVPAGAATADLDLSSWVLSAGVGYDLVQSKKGRLAIVGGLRYLDLEVESDLTIQGTQVSDASGSQDLLDGTIGLRGYISLGKSWYLPYYADVGTGDSDVSYQLFAGIGYQFGWGDIRLGYRHLCIEMEDDKVMQDMTISGPVLGIGFRF